MPTRVQPPPPREGVGRETPIVETARLDPGGERDVRTWLVVLAVLALIALAVVKPWEARERPGALAVASPASPDASPPAATVESGSAITYQNWVLPSGDQPAESDEAMARRCNRPLGWRVYASSKWHGTAFRTFVAMTPVREAASPVDPAIPVVPVYGSDVLGIGFCAPVVGDLQPPPGLTVELWHIGADGRAGRVSARRIEPERPSSLVGLYGRQHEELRDDRAARWANGRYVFRLTGPEGSDFSVWFGIEVNPSS